MGDVRYRSRTVPVATAPACRMPAALDSSGTSIEGHLTSLGFRRFQKVETARGDGVGDGVGH